MKLSKELIYDLPEIKISSNNFREGIIQADKNLEHLKNLAKRAKELDNLLGSYFSVTVADGKVFYQVVEKDNFKDKGIVKRCAGICLDEYVHELLGYEAELPIAKIKELVNRETALQKLFGN